MIAKFQLSLKHLKKPKPKPKIDLALLQRLKLGKTAGSDEVYTKMLKALDEEGVNVVWGITSEIFIALPKVPGTLGCASHRIISLMSHLLKIPLKIILQRIRCQPLPEIPQTQCGFMKDRGTRNAIFILRMLEERRIKH